MSWNYFLPPQHLFMARRQAIPTELPEASSLPIAQSEPHVEATVSRGGNKRDEKWSQFQTQLESCQNCKLARTRTQVVIGEGSPTASLVFLGEGPGEQEDLEGRPFVGRAGQLLDKMIVAMGMTRDQVYITNVVKCRPPGNRFPEPDEIVACSNFYKQQLNWIAPKVVVALGRCAAQSLLENDLPIGKVRGTWKQLSNGVWVMPTYHPSYLLRNPEAKKEVWSDLKQVMAKISQFN